METKTKTKMTLTLLEGSDLGKGFDLECNGRDFHVQSSPDGSWMVFGFISTIKNANEAHIESLSFEADELRQVIEHCAERGMKGLKGMKKVEESAKKGLTVGKE